MPTYTETINNYNTSADSAALIERTISRRKNLTMGYFAVVVFRKGRVRTTLKGPVSRVNSIPDDIIIEYGKVLNKVRRWVADLEADFPVL